MDKQFAGWKDKMKQKLEDVKKKMDEGEDEIAPPKQTESQPTPPRKALKFSINTMNEFSHEELQSVILKYDSEHKKKVQIIVEKDEEIQDLQEQLENIQNQSQRGGI